jgi:hypothetical protein
MTYDLEELQEVLDSLNINYGVWKSNSRGIKYRAIADNDRYQVIKSLLEVFKNRGKDKEYFRTNNVKDFVAKFFFPEPRTEHKTAAKVRGCYDLVKGELRQAILEVWGTPNDIAGKKLEEVQAAPYQPPKPSAQPQYKKPAPEDDEKPIAIRPDPKNIPYEKIDELEVDEEFAKLLEEASKNE